MKDMIQVGVIAWRDPKTGAFLPSEPIYEERTEAHDQARDKMIRIAGKIIGGWMGKESA